MTSNANLLKNIFSYLEAKDLAKLENINHEYKKNAQNFNHVWREECNKYFCSDYQYNSIIINYDIFITQYKSYFHKQAIQMDQINWKNLYKSAIKNKLEMANYKVNENLRHLNLGEDLCKVEEIIYQILKEFLTQPKLRREKLYVENEINSTHQTHNYDFGYHQSRLYEFYDNIFNKNESKPKPNLLENNYDLNNFYLKSEDLYFAKGLQNFKDLFLLFIKNDSVENKMKLGKLRWYSCEENLIFSSEETFGTESEEEHPIIYILRSIFAKILIFCRISFNYIRKYETSCYNSSKPDSCELDQLFINEFIKRHRTYFESAIEINNQLENLNVLVNYLYENLFEGYPSNPKFSFYRMMVIAWNKQVLHPLLKNENLNLTSKVNNLFSNYISKSFVTKIESESSAPSDTLLYEDKDMIFKYFIENVASAILDYDCNENSIYYINSSLMKTSEFYNNFEETILKTFFRQINLIVSNKIDAVPLIFNLYKDFDSHFKFINKTKFFFIKILCEVCVMSSVDILKIKFNEFLNNIPLKDTISYLKIRKNSYGIGIENLINNNQINLINKDLYKIALEFYEDEIVAEFSFNHFIDQIKKCSENSYLINSIQNGILFYYNELKKNEEINSKIIKENKKRNVILSNDIFASYISIEFSVIEQNFLYEKIKEEIDLYNRELVKRNNILEFQIQESNEIYNDYLNRLINPNKI